MLSNSEGEASDEEREKRRADLPPVGKIINLDEMEEMAKRVLGPESKAYGFYASVAEDGHGQRLPSLPAASLLSPRLLSDQGSFLFPFLQAFRNSRDAYQYVRLRPRVLRPVSVVSTSTTFLSNSPPSPLPIFIAPAARAATGHPDGERTLVQGAAATGLVQCVSSSASLSVQQILQERDRVAGEGGGKKPEAWFQLYVARDRVATAEKIKQAIACVPPSTTTLSLTFEAADRQTKMERRRHRHPVDGRPRLPGQARERQDLARLGSEDGLGDPVRRGSQLEGHLLGPKHRSRDPRVAQGRRYVLTRVEQSPFDLIIHHLSSASPEDTLLAFEHGAAGVVLSNHGSSRQLLARRVSLLTNSSLSFRWSTA